VRGMDSRDDVREFLASRRAKISPAQAGLPDYGGTRGVAGLRRDEAAMLAGVSMQERQGAVRFAGSSRLSGQR
jgi:hypothetical protein